MPITVTKKKVVETIETIKVDEDGKGGKYSENFA